MTDSQHLTVPVAGKRDSDLAIKGFLTKKSSGLFGGSNLRYLPV